VLRGGIAASFTISACLPKASGCVPAYRACRFSWRLTLRVRKDGGEGRAQNATLRGETYKRGAGAALPRLGRARSPPLLPPAATLYAHQRTAAGRQTGVLRRGGGKRAPLSRSTNALAHCRWRWRQKTSSGGNGGNARL